MEQSFLSRLILRHRLRLALRRMTPLQREIFLALRFKADTVARLADVHGLSSDAILEEFAQALLVLVRTLNPPRRSWRNWWLR
ncbi:RNA polymerase subunit sigma [Novosphingobium sp. LASN5T]|uniref:RNA polymerase subunit sigma n=1 Tax=Novosphingobium sp. LASN5T TaxID=2491021 RepID=UPI000F5E4DC1|nr:RNA polymerase subunit sigma [Novosphingobium sp. LASN5T]RQW44838.1 RNA polymerase subunit sigma [Novosphingobium sp. LASN5T]